MNIFYKVCIVLLIVGGINWGLIGLFNFNAVGWLFGGAQSFFARAVFTIVGASAFAAIPALFALQAEQAEST